jgi:hypothetical protein
MLMLAPAVAPVPASVVCVMENEVTADPTVMLADAAAAPTPRI